MNPIAVSVLVFICLATSAFAGLYFSARLSLQDPANDAINVVRLVASIFVVMTSLVLGLMLNSAKNRYDSVNRDVHVFATEAILLDRNLRLMGPAADEARSRLRAYVKLASTWKAAGYDQLLAPNPQSEQLLNSFHEALQAMSARNAEQLALWNAARQGYERIVGIRWGLLQQAEGSIPTHLLVTVTCWLALVFGSFGYGAPRNAVVVVSLLVAAALMAATLELILELDSPFFGSIAVSSAPIHRALAEMQR